MPGIVYCLLANYPNVLQCAALREMLNLDTLAKKLALPMPGRASVRCRVPDISPTTGLFPVSVRLLLSNFLKKMLKIEQLIIFYKPPPHRGRTLRKSR